MLETFFLVWAQADPAAEAPTHRLCLVLGDLTLPETNEKMQMESLEQESACLQVNHQDVGAQGATSSALLSPCGLFNSYEEGIL